MGGQSLGAFTLLTDGSGRHGIALLIRVRGSTACTAVQLSGSKVLLSSDIKTNAALEYSLIRVKSTALHCQAAYGCTSMRSWEDCL